MFGLVLSSTTPLFTVVISVSIIILVTSLLNSGGVFMSIWVPHLLLDFIRVFAMEVHVDLTVRRLLVGGVVAPVRLPVMVMVILPTVLSGLASVSRFISAFSRVILL